MHFEPGSFLAVTVLVFVLPVVLPVVLIATRVLPSVRICRRSRVSAVGSGRGEPDAEGDERDGLQGGTNASRVRVATAPEDAVTQCPLAAASTAMPTAEIRPPAPIRGNRRSATRWTWPSS
ncbi:MAG: hypothetical protein QOF53_2986 [Nocardioidaceae bacterium]|nr:hypothetical protein [Nocardioidaceae bacterium]